MIGIISGTALKHMELENAGVTPANERREAYKIGMLGGTKVMFMDRHGSGKLPHEVTYKENIRAFAVAPCKAIIGVYSVGHIDPRIQVGAMIVPNQIIDYTSGRDSLYKGLGDPHVDFTWPFHADLRLALIKACHSQNRDANGLMLPTFVQGVLAVTQGPRLETKAEVERMKKDGATLVGMTAMPEAILARQLEVPFAALAVSVNKAAGVGFEQVVNVGKVDANLLVNVLTRAVQILSNIEL